MNSACSDRSGAAAVSSSRGVAGEASIPSFDHVAYGPRVQPPPAPPRADPHRDTPGIRLRSGVHPHHCSRTSRAVFLADIGFLYLGVRRCIRRRLPRGSRPLVLEIVVFHVSAMAGRAVAPDRLIPAKQLHYDDGVTLAREVRLNLNASDEKGCFGIVSVFEYFAALVAVKVSQTDRSIGTSTAVPRSASRSLYGELISISYMYCAGRRRGGDLPGLEAWDTHRAGVGHLCGRTRWEAAHRDGALFDGLVTCIYPRNKPKGRGAA